LYRSLRPKLNPLQHLEMVHHYPAFAEKLINACITAEERPFRACPEPVEGAA